MAYHYNGLLLSYNSFEVIGCNVFAYRYVHVCLICLPPSITNCIIIILCMSYQLIDDDVEVSTSQWGGRTTIALRQCHRRAVAGVYVMRYTPHLPHRPAIPAIRATAGQ